MRFARPGLLVALCALLSAGARAEDVASGAVTRPATKTNRWAEDWSGLADPARRTQAFDDLKYIPLFAADPKSYLSLGLTLRERVESNRMPAFGIGGPRGDSYLLQRLQIHLDARLNENWQIFAQLEDVRAPGKRVITSVDENILDLRLAFLSYRAAGEDGTVKARVGRQDFAFDLQRFVSSRDGPNVRQSFDALWADWESGPWRVLGFVSQPVQYRFAEPFDDISTRAFRFSTLRVERKVLGDQELSAYWGLYERDGARFLDAAGTETRHVLDIRYAGSAGRFDWDVEAMGQFGRVGRDGIAAWAAGSRVGYTLADLPWQPRLGLQGDAASGDGRRDDGVLGTFNPLFPNGYYFTLAGYTSYANLLHLKPSLTVHPTTGLAVSAALGLQWRQTVSDAIYVQPSNPVPGTAGRGHPWSGAYGQLRADYVFAPGLTGAVEAVRFSAGDTIRRAGGKDGTYLGVELRTAW
ncbi:alginate export family protein [Methylobacterium currus]|uniref:Alginate export family protein n=1 Tax=Methylobacterium currus TaxID=2051553 RepID=A0A2R4WFE1_9HYPH|nr:alginate export family protein [Methylobacterium currus]AWB20267.1 alginate export family protein [Methylobacterium currus]